MPSTGSANSAQAVVISEAARGGVVRNSAPLKRAGQKLAGTNAPPASEAIWAPYTPVRSYAIDEVHSGGSGGGSGGDFVAVTVAVRGGEDVDGSFGLPLVKSTKSG